nr:O-antigen ligase family protein [Nocardioides sp. zg-1230]
MIASIFFSMSRSAYLCALAGMIVLAMSWDLRRRLRALAFLSVVSAVMYVMVPGLLGSIQGLFSNAGEDPSIASRTGSYDIAGAFISSSPWVGKGFGTFLPKYWILDNAYLGMTIESGLLGLLALLTLIVAGLVSARGARGVLQAEQDAGRAAGHDAGREEHVQYTQAVLASVAAGACGLAFFDAFAFPQTAGCFFLFIGIAGAMRRLTRASAAVPSSGRG